jgi:hypothetical protein
MLSDVESRLRDASKTDKPVQRALWIGEAMGKLEAAAKILQHLGVPVEVDPQVKRVAELRSAIGMALL